MLKKLANIFLVFAIFFSFFKFLFFWMVEVTDSWFFWGLADFMRTGIYHAPHPYYYTSVSTMEPPLYSVFLYLFQYFPRADILIHLLQIVGFIIATFCLYKILSFYILNDLAKIIAAVFLFIPANIIYESQLTAEPLALTFITIYIYFAYLIIKKGEEKFVKYLFVFSFFMTLQRYNFIVFLPISLFLFFKSKNRKLTDFYYLLISIFFLFAWVLTNHQLNNSWGLSNAEGKHLYNRIVWTDGALPKEDDPNLMLLKSLTKRETALQQPWWWIEDKLRTDAGMDETKSSNLLRKIALSALWNNPVSFIANIPKNFLISHGNRLPFSGGGYLYTRSEHPKPYCRTLGTIVLCQPIITSEWAINLWENIISLTKIYYLTDIPTFINLFIFFPGIIYIFLRGDKFIRFCAVSYTVASLIPVLFEEPNPRYMYPLFPLKIIIITYFLFQFAKYIRKKQKVKKLSK